MIQFLIGKSVKTSLLPLAFLFVPFCIHAQDYWSRIPALTSQCYGEKDIFSKQIDALRTEIRQKMDKAKEEDARRANNMTQQEKMALATKYQNMSPDEIVKMQQEMTEMAQLQATFEEASAEYETQFNALEEDFRNEFAQRLGTIEAEYQKLPDGEGTPDWAIKKGKELMGQYNSTYEEICSKYFTASNSEFRKWLDSFQSFLREQEVPYNKKVMKMQYGQFGITPDETMATLMAVDRYLEKCNLIFGLRRPYPQG